MINPSCYEVITKYFASHKEAKKMDSLDVYNLLSSYTKPYVHTTKDANKVLNFIRELQKTDDFLIEI